MVTRSVGPASARVRDIRLKMFIQPITNHQSHIEPLATYRARVNASFWVPCARQSRTNEQTHRETYRVQLVSLLIQMTVRRCVISGPRNSKRLKNVQPLKAKKLSLMRELFFRSLETAFLISRARCAFFHTQYLVPVQVRTYTQTYRETYQLSRVS